MGTRTIECGAEYFSPEATLLSDQLARYDMRDEDGRFFLVSGDIACRVWTRGDKVTVECGDTDDDEKKVRDLFDLPGDGGKDRYEEIHSAISRMVGDESLDVPDEVKDVVAECRGLRILKQDVREIMYTAILTPQKTDDSVRRVINRLCAEAGGEASFGDYRFRSFPDAETLMRKETRFFEEIGAGYRGRNLFVLSRRIGADPGKGYMSKLSAANEFDLMSGMDSVVCRASSRLMYMLTKDYDVREDDEVKKLYERLWQEKEEKASKKLQSAENLLAANGMKIMGEVSESDEDASGKKKERNYFVGTGVGPKVATCIALFAYNRLECCLVDTWMENVYRDYFKGKKRDGGEHTGVFRENLLAVFGRLPAVHVLRDKGKRRGAALRKSAV